MASLGIPVILALLVLIVACIVPYWKIFQKAGFAPALSLLMIIPLINFVMIFYLAFAEWPIHKQLNR